MTELVLSCPRFMRNLTGQHASLILCLPRIPALAVHWSAIRLGDTGRHCLTLRITHWAKLSRGQAAQSIHPILAWGTIYQAFVFLVNLYKQTFARIFYPILPYFPNISLYFIRTFIPFVQIGVLICILLFILCEIDLTFDFKCLLVSVCRPVEPQGWSTNEIIRGTGTL